MSCIALYHTKAGPKETQWVTLLRKLWSLIPGYYDIPFELTSEKWVQAGFSVNLPFN